MPCASPKSAQAKTQHFTLTSGRSSLEEEEKNIVSTFLPESRAEQNDKALGGLHATRSQGSPSKNEEDVHHISSPPDIFKEEKEHDHGTAYTNPEVEAAWLAERNAYLDRFQIPIITVTRPSGRTLLIEDMPPWRSKFRSMSWKHQFFKWNRSKMLSPLNAYGNEMFKKQRRRAKRRRCAEE